MYEPFEHQRGSGMTGVGAAVTTTDEYGKHGEESSDNAGRQYDGRHRRRDIDTVTATNHDSAGWPVGVHVSRRSFQHHLQQSNDRWRRRAR